MSVLASEKGLAEGSKPWSGNNVSDLRVCTRPWGSGSSTFRSSGGNSIDCDSLYLGPSVNLLACIQAVGSEKKGALYISNRRGQLLAPSHSTPHLWNGYRMEGPEVPDSQGEMTEVQSMVSRWSGDGKIQSTLEGKARAQSGRGALTLPGEG